MNNHTNYDKLFESICEERKIKFQDVAKDHTGFEDDVNRKFWYRNRSASAGKDYIWLGEYEDSQLRTISFFHELGHCIDPNGHHKSKYIQEKSAWKVGLKAAKKHGIKFSKKACRWKNKQLRTYLKYK